MLSIFTKEISTFFASLIAYIVIGVFLIMVGLFMWVFPDTSVLYYNYASMETLFSLAPMVFMFLIPAITMRSFAEENNRGTMEFLSTKPLKAWDIILGKFFANWMLVAFALIPTLLYYYSVYQLGSPKGNLDTGGIIGSYIGLFLLAGTFVAIGLWSSSMTNNQIIAFIIAAFLCFLVYFGFTYLSQLPIFSVSVSVLIQKLGISDHYTQISRGLLDSRDILYFVSSIAIFLILTRLSILKK